MTVARWSLALPLAALASLGLSCGRDEICHGPACTPCPPDGCASGAGVIHRSVGPGSTSALASGEGNALRIEGSVATFASPLPDRIGVGDALVSTFGDSTSIAFITRRRSATAYELQTAEGEAPASPPGTTTTWSIYRAYASLADASTQTANRAIPAQVADFDAPFRTAANDLVALGKIWSIACYADAVDSLDLVDGPRYAHFGSWSTSADFYLRIYAPSDVQEVGVSQRHAGALDPSRYTLRKTANWDNSYVGLITLRTQYARVEGLQLVDTSTNSQDAALKLEPTGPGEFRVAGNLVFGDPGNARSADGIVPYGGGVASIVLVYDNVVAGMSRAAFSMAASDDNPLTGGLSARLFNNTFANCAIGIETGHASVLALNNAVATTSLCVNPITPLDARSDYNTCSRDELADESHSRRNATPIWTDPDAGDFHLSPLDTVAAGHGADLLGATYASLQVPFGIDLDGQLRAGTWDIGADQR